MSEFIPSENYDSLLRQFNAMKNLIKSMESTNSALQKSNNDLVRQLSLVNHDEINALRETNQALTNRIDELENRPAETKVKAEGIMEAVNCLERPDVPLAPSLIMSDDLIEYANKLEKGDV